MGKETENFDIIIVETAEGEEITRYAVPEGVLDRLEEEAKSLNVSVQDLLLDVILNPGKNLS